MNRRLQSNILLLITATIWGFAFVAQRVGMDFVGPFAFNGVRFALGATALLPLSYFLDRQSQSKAIKPIAFSNRDLLRAGLLGGLFLFGGSSLQQIGIVTTTAGKAGFITGLYVVLVPVFGLFLGQKTTNLTWIGAILASIGLYFLSVKPDWTMERGDLFVLGSAFMWTAHVHLLAKVAPNTDPIKLSIIQFYITALMSGIVAMFAETTTLEGLAGARDAILYAGLMSVGIAYTFQVLGQRHANPSHASIIMSLEALFAVIGGVWLLSETLDQRGLIGCALMMAGMLISQLQPGENTSAVAAEVS